jgi:uncharacterized RDD family membrane protein YckC
MPASRVSQPAALWRRLAAAAYDLFLVLALLMVLTGLVILARAGAAIDPGSVWFQTLLAAAWWLYFAWSWTHGGQTVGMRAWRLILRSEAPDGRISWRQASLRFAAAGLSALPAGLGFLWAIVDRDRRCWHDRWSGTRLLHRPALTQSEQRERRNQQ